MRIRDIIGTKNIQGVVTIAPDATVRDLLGLLAENNIGALVVSRDGSEVDGIVSERDIVRRLRDDESVLDAAVSTIMTTTVHTCPPEADLDSVMTEMTERRIRHVPVVGDDGLCGLVSIGDVVKTRMDELKTEQERLQAYIMQG